GFAGAGASSQLSSAGAGVGNGGGFPPLLLIAATIFFAASRGRAPWSTATAARGLVAPALSSSASPLPPPLTCAGVSVLDWIACLAKSSSCSRRIGCSPVTKESYGPPGLRMGRRPDPFYRSRPRNRAFSTGHFL